MNPSVKMSEQIRKGTERSGRTMRMSTWWPRATVAAICMALVSGIHAQQPNILLVIADDLGLDPVPNYLPGPQKAPMPNLEALMASGLTFDNLWVNPVCAPTRAAIITGRYGNDTGVLNAGQDSRLPDDAVTLHRYLDSIASGYASSIIGKWHLGGNTAEATHPNDMGIPYYAGLLMGAAPYNAWPLVVNGTQSISTEYITTAITDMAIDWIGQQSSPWFCWVAYTAPHTPFHLPPQDLHTQGQLPTDPATINADPLPYYLAMIESLDHEVGRLLASLPPGELANTVVIFIGDNGTANQVIQEPYSVTQAKGTLYEGALRVPFVMSGPGVTRVGERESGLVNSTDLFATIVELTGHTLPAYEDSRSIVPMLSTSGYVARDCMRADVMLTPLTGGHAKRNNRYKLIVMDSGTEEFYDLQNDPYESADLLSGTLTAEEQAVYELLQADCALSTGLSPTTSPSGGIELFPNPAREVLMITGLPPQRTVYSVYGTDGRMVLEGTMTGPNASIATNDIPAGAYMLVIGRSRHRFIKQ